MLRALRDSGVCRDEPQCHRRYPRSEEERKGDPQCPCKIKRTEIPLAPRCRIKLRFNVNFLANRPHRPRTYQPQCCPNRDDHRVTVKSSLGRMGRRQCASNWHRKAEKKKKVPQRYHKPPAYDGATRTAKPDKGGACNELLQPRRSWLPDQSTSLCSRVIEN
jgi:hypothetical protein